MLLVLLVQGKLWCWSCGVGCFIVRAGVGVGGAVAGDNNQIGPTVHTKIYK